MYISPFKKYSTVLLFVLIYCVSTTIFAQNETDSVVKLDTIAFKKSLEGKSLDETVSKLFDYYTSDSLKASLTSRHIKNTYMVSGTRKEKALAYISVPIWEGKINNTEEALSLLAKGIKITRELKNDNLLYLGLMRKGVIDFYHADHKRALASFYEALAIAKKVKNKKREIFVKSNIGLVRMQAYDRIGAIELFLEIVEEIKKDPSLVNAQQELEIYLNLCGAYTYLEDFDAAISYCEKGASIEVENYDPIDEAHFLSSFAEIARHKKEYKKSHRLLDEAEEVVKESVGRENLELFLKFYRARTYFDEKKYQLAIDELLKIEQMKSEYDVEILSLQQMYYFLAKSYNELGNKDAAIIYYDKAQQIGNENDKKRDELNINLIKKYDLVELKEEVEDLKRKSQRTKLTYILGIILLVIIIVGLLIFNKKQQQKNKARFAKLMHQLEEKRKNEKLRNDLKQTDQKTVAVTTSKETSKSKPVKIDPKMAEILVKLEEFEEKELFLSNESTLVEVAKKIQTNTTYLSKVINTHKEKSFTAYITDLRVDYAIERLSHDRKFRSFTIGAIAQEIGFKRSESFSKAFKVKTGLYPSYFIKELEKQLSSESE